jgi:hypothetical protein
MDVICHCPHIDELHHPTLRFLRVDGSHSFPQGRLSSS